MYNIDTVQYEAYENNDIYGFWWSYLHRLSVIQIVALMCCRVFCTLYYLLEFGHSINCVRLDKPEIDDEVGAGGEMISHA